MISENLGTNARYSGACPGYQMASVIAGGPAPLIAAKILEKTNSSIGISWYILGCSVVAMAALLLMPRRVAAEDPSIIDINEAEARQLAAAAAPRK